MAKIGYRSFNHIKDTIDARFASFSLFAGVFNQVLNENRLFYIYFYFPFFAISVDR